MDKEDVYTHHTFLCVYTAGIPQWLSAEESACNAGAVAGATGSIAGLGRSLREGNANPLSILAWEIPWTEEPVEFMGSQNGWTRLSNYTTKSVCVCI